MKQLNSYINGIYKMKDQMISKQIGILVIGLVCSGLSSFVYAGGDFAPPTVSAVDKLGVNLANGQISQSLNTVSIGGAMGLSHNISTYTNEFSMTGYRGYQDKFYAITRSKVIGLAVTGYGFLDVLNVHDFENSEDFIVKVNDQRVHSDSTATSGITYKALGDERHTLALTNDGYLIWTKPNGTVVRFKLGVIKPFVSAQLESITYPNNFTITIESPYTVTTNTGFRLKYIYVNDNGASSSSSSSSIGPSSIPVAPSNLQSKLVANCAHTATWDAVVNATSYKFRESSLNTPNNPGDIPASKLSQNVVCTVDYPDSNKPQWLQACNANGCSPKSYFPGAQPDPLSSAINVPQANPLLWSQRNPRFIQAVNDAFENCATENVQCNLTWPKATFTWPAGMPRAMFIGENIFTVTNAMGGNTNFRFKSFDLAFEDEEGQKIIPGQIAGQRYSPRLVGVKPASSIGETITYTYKNLTAPKSGGDSSWIELVKDAGVVTSAKLINASEGYQDGVNQGNEPRISAASNTGGILYVLQRSQPQGTLNEVKTLKGLAKYEPDSFRNFITSYEPLGALSESYEYKRGNLTKITYGDGFTAEATYEDFCNQTNYRYCNKPKTTTDRNTKTTSYKYHTLSGEVEKVTLPANKNNVSAITRYHYEPMAAKYFQNGAKVESSKPIYLKVLEKTCIKTATIAETATEVNGCAGGEADEVVTTYEYGKEQNLSMTGMTVKAADASGAIITKRTCYQYDMYGNRIGETQPKAGRTSCNP